MLEDTFLIPKNLYAVHGPGISVKALEIADTLVDVVNQYDQNAESEVWNFCSIYPNLSYLISIVIAH
ncbi:ANL_collapsed_G0027680.mRNA.1.CDS.1 [Saccharomyces cerevisiae]|nr:ANL_collapsed_G0027680.mRNA.1.CDS.1 [Saccharomyces cerevisiae]